MTDWIRSVPDSGRRIIKMELGPDFKPVSRFRGRSDWRDLAVGVAKYTSPEERERTAMRGAARALVESASTPNELYWFFAASAMSVAGGSAVLGDLFRRTTGWDPNGPDSLVLLEQAIGQMLGEARDEIELWRRMGIRVPGAALPAYGSAPSTLEAQAVALDSAHGEPVR